MSRQTFPAAVAATVALHSEFAPSVSQVAPLAHAVWDAAQAGASDEAQFRAAVTAGTAALVRTLRELAA